jgi:hypothetical protein
MAAAIIREKSPLSVSFGDFDRRAGSKEPSLEEPVFLFFIHLNNNKEN